MDALTHDVRSALRSLTKARGFAAVAILVFALGIGINTALFSIVNAVFFRPLPVEKPEELVYLYEFMNDGRAMSAISELADRTLEQFGARKDIFVEITGHGSFSTQITTGGETAMARGEMVLANYFDVLGLAPLLG